MGSFVFCFVFNFVCVVYLYTEHLCKCILAGDGLAGPKHVGIIRQYVAKKQKNAVLSQLQVSCSGRHSSAWRHVPLALSQLPRFVVPHIFGDEFEALAALR